MWVVIIYDEYDPCSSGVFSDVLGPYATKEEADAKVARLKSVGFPSSDAQKLTLEHFSDSYEVRP